MTVTTEEIIQKINNILDRNGCNQNEVKIIIDSLKKEWEL
jgi:hypothetical protein